MKLLAHMVVGTAENFSTGSPHGVEMCGVNGVEFGSRCCWGGLLDAMGLMGSVQHAVLTYADSNGMRLRLHSWTVSMLRKDACILMALQIPIPPAQDKR